MSKRPTGRLLRVAPAALMMTSQTMETGIMGYYSGKIKSDGECAHVRRDLRGCSLPAGHQEPHCNMTEPSETWANDDGEFINNRSEWLALIDAL